MPITRLGSPLRPPSVKATDTSRRCRPGVHRKGWYCFWGRCLRSAGTVRPSAQPTARIISPRGSNMGARRMQPLPMGRGRKWCRHLRPYRRRHCRRRDASALLLHGTAPQQAPLAATQRALMLPPPHPPDALPYKAGGGVKKRGLGTRSGQGAGDGVGYARPGRAPNPSACSGSEELQRRSPSPPGSDAALPILARVPQTPDGRSLQHPVPRNVPASPATAAARENNGTFPVYPKRIRVQTNATKCSRRLTNASALCP